MDAPGTKCAPGTTRAPGTTCALPCRVSEAAVRRAHLLRGQLSQVLLNRLERRRGPVGEAASAVLALFLADTVRAHWPVPALAPRQLARHHTEPAKCSTFSQADKRTHYLYEQTV